MIITMKSTATLDEVSSVLARIRETGFEPHEDHGVTTVIGVRGDTSSLEEDFFFLPGVSRVQRVTSRFKEVSREFHPRSTVITVGGARIGGGKPVLIAGPGGVESERQLRETAAGVKAAGAQLLRGGAFKPRTSPYAFQGLGEEGLRLLQMVRQEFDLPIVTEITGPREVELFLRYQVDVFQVGARNMQNYDLLNELRQIDRPVLLKRAPSATIEEFLLAAEYLLHDKGGDRGNSQVILCERGVRNFETSYRNVLDLNAVAHIKNISHLPILADPSHSAGRAELVAPLARAAIACGADGLLVEVHHCPREARCDARQQLTPGQFADLVKEISPFVRP